MDNQALGEEVNDSRGARCGRRQGTRIPRLLEGYWGLRYRPGPSPSVHRKLRSQHGQRLVLILLLTNHLFLTDENSWLSYWSNVDGSPVVPPSSNSSVPSNSTLTPSPSANITFYGLLAENGTNPRYEKVFDEWGLGHYFYLLIYALIGTAQVPPI